MPWTDESCKTLKAMWCDGRSAREVAGRLGVTRNAVIGKANRMGLKHNSNALRAEEPAPPKSPLQLTERMCRWPIGHPGEADFHFCGAQRAPGRPYCEEHCCLAYRGRTPEAA